MQSSTLNSNESLGMMEEMKDFDTKMETKSKILLHEIDIYTLLRNTGLE